MNANSVSYAVLSWNVRGLGDSDKCKTVRDTLVSSRADIICIQESKLHEVSPSKAREFLPTPLSDFQVVDADGLRGGLVTAWNARSLSLSSSLHRKHTLTLFFTSTDHPHMNFPRNLVSLQRFCITRERLIIDAIIKSSCPLNISFVRLLDQ